MRVTDDHKRKHGSGRQIREVRGGVCIQKKLNQWADKSCVLLVMDTQLDVEDFVRYSTQKEDYSCILGNVIVNLY